MFIAGSDMRSLVNETQIIVQSSLCVYVYQSRRKRSCGRQQQLQFRRRLFSCFLPSDLRKEDEEDEKFDDESRDGGTSL